MPLLPYLLCFSLPAILLADFYLGILSNFSVVITVFIFIPIFDHIYGPKEEFFSDKYNEQRETSSGFKWILYAYVPTQIALFVWACYVATNVPMSTTEFIGLSISMGLIAGGLGINISHELNHKKPWYCKRMADTLLLMVCYNHFAIEHNHGHHKNVATDRDPATAKRGQTLYAFLPSTLIGSYRSAWQNEAEELKRKNKAFWSLSNRMIWYSISSILLFVSVFLIFGLFATQLLVIQCITAILLLETVNYVEHYGLTRQYDANKNRYEPVNHMHSWNTSHYVSNLFLLNLQLHSDHHKNPMKWYTNLVNINGSPQLPSGYPLMILLALVPPAWFSVMDKKIAELGKA